MKRTLLFALFVALIASACGGSDAPKKGKASVPVVIITDDDAGRTEQSGQTDQDMDGSEDTTNARPDCGEGEFLIDGVCRQFERFVSATASWGRVVDINGERLQTSVSACTTELVPGGSMAEPVYDIIAETDECMAWRSSEGAEGTPLYRNVPLDAGAVTFAAPSVTVEALPLASETGCATINDGEGGLFQPGDEIEVSTTGGADFPAMTTTFVVPVAPDVVHTDIVAGEVVTFEWNGTGDELVTAWISTTDTDGQPVHISCRTADDGHFEFPPSLTQHLAAEPLSVSVNFFRSAFRMEAVNEGAIQAGATVFEALNEYNAN